MKLWFRLTLVVVALLAGVIGTVVLTSGGGSDPVKRTSEAVATATPALPAIQGPQLRMGDLVYNVTDVRVMNYDSPSSAPYLVNLQRPAKGAGYLAVFLRVYNLGKRKQASAAGYLLEPSKQPGLAEMVKPAESPYQFTLGQAVPAGGVVPAPGTPAAAGKFPGGMLLYGINGDSTKNQPFDLVIHDADGRLAKLRLPPVPSLTGRGHG